MGCKYMVKVKWQDTTYCGCMVMRNEGNSAKYPQPSRQLDMYVTGSENWQGAGDGNNWHLCVGGKHRVVGVTPSQACGVYARGTKQDAALAKKFRPPKQPKASKTSKSTANSRKVAQRSSSHSQASTPSAGAFGRVHPDTASIGTVVGKVVLAAIALTVIIVLIGVVTDFFGGLFGGQSDPISLPTHVNQEAVATQPPTSAPITETPEEHAIREVYEFRLAALGGVTLGNFLERISPSGEWDIRFGTEVTFEGETELGWLELFVWNINIETNQIGLGIQLDGVGIPLEEFLELF